ncbi:hypothetical protein LCGC14_1876730, partial [marine sediment metagenome]
MSRKKRVFNEQYEGGYLTLTGTYSGPFNKKTSRDFKKEIYKILIDIHNTKLRRLESSWRRFNSLLKHSEKLYKKLPTSIKVEGIKQLLESENKIKTFVDTYQREELSEDPIKIKKAAIKKLELIKNQIETKRKEPDRQIEIVKMNFVSEQWSEYEAFFNEDLSFRKEVREAIRHHFKVKRNSDFEIYDYLIRIIKARISISGILKSRIDKKRTDLLETIHKPQMLLPDMRHFNFVSFFSYMLLNSDLFIETKHKLCVIKLDMIKFYKNFFRLFSKSDKDFYGKLKELEFDKNLFVPTFLGTDKLHRLKYLIDKQESGILLYKEVQTKNVVDIELDPKYIKDPRIKSDEQKTPVFYKHQSNVLIKLDIEKILFNLFKELYFPDQEELLDTQLKKIKKSNKSHRLIKKYRIKVVVPIIIIITVVLVMAFFSSIPGSIRIQKYDSVK